jgi:hypothetical protein
MNKYRKLRIEKRRKEPPFQVGDGYLTYKHIQSDEDGWVDAKVYRPIPYDLVKVKTQGKHKYCWWNGHFWEGFRLQAQDLIFSWKIEKEGREYAG